MGDRNVLLDIVVFVNANLHSIRALVDMNFQERDFAVVDDLRDGANIGTQHRAAAVLVYMLRLVRRFVDHEDEALSIRTPTVASSRGRPLQKAYVIQ